MKKYMLFTALAVAFGLMLMSTIGCSSVQEQQEKVLEKMTPSLRADYRDGLESLIENYDSLYDRDGNPLPEDAE